MAFLGLGLEIWLGLTAVLLYILYRYLTQYWGLYERQGIPVIKPYLLLGSEPGIYKRIAHEDDLENSRKYGDKWVSYGGLTPHFFTTDLELIKNVLVKDFDKFSGRRKFEFNERARAKGFTESMDLLEGEKWKNVRQLFTPAFTTSKLKATSEHVTISTNNLIDWMNDDMKANGNNELDVIPYFKNYMMDSVMRTGYGTQMTDLRNTKDEFLRHAGKLIGMEVMSTPLALIVHFGSLGKYFDALDPTAAEYITGTAKAMLDMRRKSGEKRGDFIDHIIDLCDKIKDNENYKKLDITETTITFQSILFLLAGFETTQLTLTYLTFRLANHPEIQDKLYQEIKSVMAKHDGKLSHDALTEMPYLEACLQESLRMSPGLIRNERLCAEDYQYKNITIYKGTIVQIPLFPLQYDPDQFPDPYSYKPERMLEKTFNPHSLQPFGLGPRSCIGMRHALEVVKGTMVLLLHKFKFVAVDTKLSYKKGMIFTTGIQHMKVILEDRE